MPYCVLFSKTKRTIHIWGLGGLAFNIMQPIVHRVINIGKYPQSYLLLQPIA